MENELKITAQCTRDFYFFPKQLVVNDMLSKSILNEDVRRVIGTVHEINKSKKKKKSGKCPFG